MRDMHSIVYCAIYARKSNEQRGVTEEQRSVERQVRHAREYAKRKGWIVLEDCVFVDDGISGAEFSARPGYMRLMNALRPRPAFSVVICSEESRLGRESIETAYTLKELIVAGVRVFYYLDDRERTINSPAEKMMLATSAFADEMERERASQRVKDAMRTKFRAGHVTGRIPYGYRGDAVLDEATGERLYVRYVLDPETAAIVRRIFARYLAGAGVARIATELNRDKVATISTRARFGWTSTAVRHLLSNPLYKGLVEYGKRQWKNAFGQRQKMGVRPDAEVFRRVDESLRIVSDRDWQAVQERAARLTADMIDRNGPDRGGAQRDGNSKYLGTGFFRCAGCRGPMSVVSWPGLAGRKERRYAYQCLRYHTRGSRFCTSATSVGIAEVDDAILAAVEAVLLPKVSVAEIVDAMIAEVEAVRPTSMVKKWRAALEDLEAQRDRLVEGLAKATTKVAAIVRAVEAREAEIAALRTKIADVEATRVGPPVSRAELTRRVRERVDGVRGVLRRRHMTEVRDLFREVLDGPVWMTGTRRPGDTRKDAHVFEFEGQLVEGVAFAGLSMSGQSHRVSFRHWKTVFRGKVAAAPAA